MGKIFRSNCTRFFRFAALWLLALNLFSCAATEDIFDPHKPSSGKAIIYIYRPSISEDIVSPTIIQLDETKRKSIDKCGYTQFEVSPGPHKVSVSTEILSVIVDSPNPSSIDLLAEPGHTYYVRYFAPPLDLTGRPVSDCYSIGCFTIYIQDEIQPHVFKYVLTESTVEKARDELKKSCPKTQH